MLPIFETLPSDFSYLRRIRAVAVLLAACVVGGLTAPAAKAGTIYVVVNGEQITTFDVEKRVALLGDRARGEIDTDAVSKEINERIRVEVSEWWKKFVQSPEINDKFREYVQEKGASTQAEVEQLKGSFARDMQQAHANTIARGIQQQVVGRARSRARAAALPKFRDSAVRELINEQLQLKAAKDLGITISDSEVEEQLANIATRNNQSPADLAATLNGMGSHISSLSSQLRARLAWGRAVRRRFGREVSVSEADVARALANSAPTSEEGGELEVALRAITIPISSPVSEANLAASYVTADRLRQRFSGCDGMASLAQATGNANYTDLGRIRVSSVPAEARAIVGATRAGNMPPPIFTGSGVQLYAVCDRRMVAGVSAEAEKVRDRLEQEQLQIRGATYLRDLCNEAFIEFREGQPPSGRRCGDV